jgi:hypothetical protein
MKEGFASLFFFSLWLHFKYLDELDLEHQSDLYSELSLGYPQYFIGGFKGFA